MARPGKTRTVGGRDDRGTPAVAPPWRDVVGVGIMVIAILVAYLPAIAGGFVLDDKLLLTDNPLIKGDDGLYRIWFTTDAIDYWPIFNSVFWLQWRLWGMEPTGYHVINLILHGAASLLIWATLRRLSIPGAFLAALLFAVHPVNVESVAWIAQCKNLLALVFSLLSILSYLETERAVPEHRAAVSVWYGLSLGAFGLAMLSKGSVAMLPLLLLAILWWLRPLTRWDLARLLPFLATSVLLIGVNMWFQNHSIDTQQVRGVGFVERLLGAGGVVWFYLSKAILPIHLAFIYPRWDVRPDHVWWWLPLAAAVAVTGILWWFRHGWSRPVLFAWGFFCIALVPVLGFADVAFMEHSLVADHYQHVAIIGVMALLGAAWATWERRAGQPASRAPIVVAVTVVAALIALTWRQSGLYADSRTLFQDTVDRNPTSSLAHNDLGVALLDAGRVREAEEQFEQALALKPAYPEAHHNRGLACTQSGRPGEAIEHFQRALQLKTDFPEAHNDLGIALARTGHLDEAIRHFVEALQQRPDFADAEYNLGIALAMRQKQVAAEKPEDASATDAP